MKDNLIGINRNRIIHKMMIYEEGCPKRIQHFLKVLSFSEIIGKEEGLDENTLDILLTAAIIHDIGIKASLTKYGNSKGPLQEKEGPPIANKMLEEEGFPKKIIDRVLYLVGHHHSYDNVKGSDYQILVEADFLVNIYENKLSQDRIKEIYDNHFVTKSGQEIFKLLYPF